MFVPVLRKSERDTVMLVKSKNDPEDHRVILYRVASNDKKLTLEEANELFEAELKIHKVKEILPITLTDSYHGWIDSPHFKEERKELVNMIEAQTRGILTNFGKSSIMQIIDGMLNKTYKMGFDVGYTTVWELIYDYECEECKYTWRNLELSPCPKCGSKFTSTVEDD
jgi:rubrerythrin